jgi:hypothetical protein
MRISSSAFILALTAALSAVAPAQDIPAPVEQAAAGTLLNADLPQDITQEWRLTTWTNKTIVADRLSLRLQGNDIRIAGSLRDLSLKCSDVASITILPAKNGFRNGAIGGLFLASMLLFSPESTPGYYMGSLKKRSYSYYYGSRAEETYATPGFSGISALCVAGSAVLAGLLTHLLKPEPQLISFDGSESPRTWSDVMAARDSRIRLHGTFSIVSTGVHDRWKEWNEKFSITDRTITNSWEPPDPVMTNVSMARLLRLGYALTPVTEIGLGVQADAVKRFYQEFHYARPGVPPQQYVRLLSQQATLTSIFATGQYQLAAIPAIHTLLHFGAGLGVDFATVDLYGYATQTTSTRPVSAALPAAVVFATAEYQWDRTLSLGLTADFTYAGSLTVPALNVLDYDNRVVLTIGEQTVSLTSFGLGLSFSYGF